MRQDFTNDEIVIQESQPGAIDTPVFLLKNFSKKAHDNAFYIETLKEHFKNHPFVAKPHKHDFYFLFYVIKGGGSHTIDFKRYPVTPGSFFVMTPGQVHTWTLDPDTDGYVIFFSPSFYKMQIENSNLLNFSFFHSGNANALIVLNKDQKKIIDFIIPEMLHEFTYKSVDIDILRSYLQNILIKLNRNYLIEESSDFANSTTFRIRKLEQLIENNFLTKKRPSQYADMMNLSPSYLNSLCKLSLNKTLSDLISERIVLEAKRLFSYSDLTINQVSNRLNFSNTSYFIRFFRKQTGTTPDQFKESSVLKNE
jgi:AraC family transcriptional activator of pobA